LVTQSVGRLTAAEIANALDAGVVVAERLCTAGLIRAAALNLQRETRIVSAEGRSCLVDVTKSNGRLVNA